jgi:protein-S-isoprenylcysteine O-methyltransferase Ste14
MNDKVRHIIGYTFGICMFILVIPYGIFQLSKADPRFFDSGLMDSAFLRTLAALPFFVTGLIFMVWSNVYLFKVGKGGPADGFNISISPRTKKLVTSGPYRFSRNPMVFGAFSFYISIGILLNSILCLTFLIIFLGMSVFYLKQTEEKRLLRDFGEEYKNYIKKVPMIFPVRIKSRG